MTALHDTASPPADCMNLPQRFVRLSFVALCSLGTLTAAADDQIDTDKKYPLGDSLRVLAADAASPAYAKLVEGMNGPDLDAEWTRVETLDNADSFLEKHGGIDAVNADTELKRAYQRRFDIREQFLGVMREHYQRQKRTPPFERGV